MRIRTPNRQGIKEAVIGSFRLQQRKDDHYTKASLNVFGNYRRAYLVRFEELGAGKQTVTFVLGKNMKESDIEINFVKDGVQLTPEETPSLSTLIRQEAEMLKVQ